MKTTLKQYKVRDIVKGFIYNEAEGKGFIRTSGKVNHSAKMPKKLYLW